MGILERKWLIDNFDSILGEMEYHREHSKMLKLKRVVLWKLNDKEGKAKLETSK